MFSLNFSLTAEAAEGAEKVIVLFHYRVVASIIHRMPYGTENSALFACSAVRNIA